MLDIVIVNWNGGAQLRECVDSILEYGSDVVGAIVVVDNGSTDGSVATVATLPRVELISTGVNLGFAAACNRGAHGRTSPYLLFLNPDTRIEADSLLVPLAYMERSDNARVGICGVQLLDDRGNVSRSCAHFPSLARFAVGALGLNKLPGLRGAAVHMTNWPHNETRAVDHVMGAFFMMRRELFQLLEGFDERFFVYLEDVDLSLRANRAGWGSTYLADARVFHAGGGTSRQVKAHRLFYSLRSRLHYGFKHFPRSQAWILLAVTGLIEPISRIGWCVLRRDIRGIGHTFVAYRMLWRGMGRIMRGEGRFPP